MIWHAVCALRTSLSAAAVARYIRQSGNGQGKWTDGVACMEYMVQAMWYGACLEHGRERVWNEERNVANEQMSS